MPTLTITRRYQFSASHRLTNMPMNHKCARVHGHNYELHLTVEAKNALDNGMVIDAANLDIDVAPIIKRIDHYDMNEACDDGTPAGAVAAAQPTVENLALYLWERLAFLRNGAAINLVRLRVYENDRLWADVTR